MAKYFVLIQQNHTTLMRREIEADNLKLYDLLYRATQEALIEAFRAGAELAYREEGYPRKSVLPSTILSELKKLKLA